MHIDPLFSLTSLQHPPRTQATASQPRPPTACRDGGKEVACAHGGRPVPFPAQHQWRADLLGQAEPPGHPPPQRVGAVGQRGHRAGGWPRQQPQPCLDRPDQGQHLTPEAWSHCRGTARGTPPPTLFPALTDKRVTPRTRLPMTDLEAAWMAIERCIQPSGSGFNVESLITSCHCPGHHPAMACSV